MENYLIPIIQRKPSNIILLVETNDPKNLPSQTVFGNILKVESSSEDSLPTCETFVLASTLHTDDGKA